MDNNEIEIRISARINELKQQMKEMSAVIAESLQASQNQCNQLGQSFNKLGDSLKKADFTALAKSASDSQSKLGQLQNTLTTLGKQSEQVGEKVGGLKKQFNTLAETATKATKQPIEQTQNLGKAFDALNSTIGKVNFNGLAQQAKNAQTGLSSLSQEMAGVAKASQSVEDATKEVPSKIKAIGDESKKTGQEPKEKVGLLKMAFDELRSKINSIDYLGKAQELYKLMQHYDQLEKELIKVSSSAVQGRLAFDWVKNFSRESGQPVEQVTEAFAALKASGLDPTGGAMKAIVDQNVQLGKSQDNVKNISDAVAGAWKKQKLEGDDIQALIKAGVPAWGLLSQATGKNADELQKMANKGQLGKEAINGLLDAMGKNASGAAEEQLKTLGGQWDTFVTTFKNSLDGIREAGALDSIEQVFTKLAGYFQDLNAYIQGLADDGTFQSWAEDIASLIGTVAGACGELIDITAEMWNSIKEAFMDLVNVFRSSTSSQTEDLDILGAGLHGIELLFIAVAGGIRILWDGLKLAVAAAVAGMVSSWEDLKASFKILQVDIQSCIEQLCTGFQTMAKTAVAALKFDFSGAKAAWNEGTSQMEQITRTRVNNIKKIMQEANDGKIASQERLANATIKLLNDGEELRNKLTGTDPLAPIKIDKPKAGAKVSTEGPTNTATGGNKSHKGSGGKQEEKSQVSVWEAELTQKKTNFQLENDLRTLSITQEINFWEQKKSLVTKNSKDVAIIQQKISALTLSAKKEQNQQQLELDKLSISSTQQSRLAEVDMEEQAAQDKLAQGLINDKQLLEMQAQFEERRYQIKLDALNASRKLIDPETDPVGLAKKFQEIEQLTQQHELKKAQIKSSIQRTSNKQDSKTTQEFSSLFTKSWDSMYSNLLNGTLKWRSTIKTLWQDVAKFFLQKMVQEPVRNWVQGKAEQLASELGFAGAKKAVDTSSAQTSISTNVSSNSAQINNNAITAGSGVASALASIPYVGPVLAASGMATMIASVIGLVGSLVSAEGGYDIPGGVNPLAQLHEQEMVLPKPYANVIRDMAGKSTNSNDATPVGDTQHFHITALDAKSVERLFRENGSALVGALKTQRRNFATS